MQAIAFLTPSSNRGERKAEGGGEGRKSLNLMI